jgi:hypothetical protein
MWMDLKVSVCGKMGMSGGGFIVPRWPITKAVSKRALSLVIISFLEFE